MSGSIYHDIIYNTSVRFAKELSCISISAAAANHAATHCQVVLYLFVFMLSIRRAEYILAKIKIYLHSFSFGNTEMAQGVEIVYHGRERGVEPA